MLKFFNNLFHFRKESCNVCYLPDRQLASEVLCMVCATYMRDLENLGSLGPGVSVEMFEACIARIFGKTLLTEVIDQLPKLVERFDRMDIDEMYPTLIAQHKLLRKVAVEAAWGGAATEDGDKLSLLVYCVIGPAYVDRFVAQAITRLAWYNTAR